MKSAIIAGLVGILFSVGFVFFVFWRDALWMGNNAADMIDKDINRDS